MSDLKSNNGIEWGLMDIISVSTIILILTLIFFLTSYPIIEDKRISFQFFRYGMSIVLFLVPFIWIKVKFGTPLKKLGFRKGYFNSFLIIILGIVIAIVFVFLLRISPMWKYALIRINPISYNIFDLIFLPITINGFASFILTPASEEVMFRGFIYPYFNKRFGIFLGIIFQAILFSLIHFGSVYNSNIYYAFIYRFIISIVLGLLYFKTGCIYSSIICHGCTNYTLVLFSILT